MMNKFDQFGPLIRIAPKEQLPENYITLFNQIEFVEVNPELTQPQIIDEVLYFPNEDSLRLFRLSGKNVIWLKGLIDDKCKKCNGQGNTGVLTHLNPVKNEVMKATIIRYLRAEGNECAVNLCKEMGLPDIFIEPMDIIIKQTVKKELTDYNLNEIAVKYAKIIKNGFKRKEIQWCEKCFIKNFNKEVREAIRNIQFHH